MTTQETHTHLARIPRLDAVRGRDVVPDVDGVVGPRSRSLQELRPPKLVVDRPQRRFLGQQSATDLVSRESYMAHYTMSFCMTSQLGPIPMAHVASRKK